MNLPLKGFVTPEKTKYHAEILANRLRKRFAHLSKRFKRQNIDCFRLYDWDIKEVRAVVDWYGSRSPSFASETRGVFEGHAVIAEYVRLQTGQDWLPQMAAATAQALNIPLERVHVKQRRTKTEEGPRYSPHPTLSHTGEKIKMRGRFEVCERDLRFWVNLDDFLDTGLYSDHRDTRVIIKDLARGKNFLNLYAYTGAFTCAAALGGAKTTVTVDRSETYQNWARDNLKLNGLVDPRHIFVQSDTNKFLARAYAQGQKFTLAFVDPPSFFKDRGRGVEFDINRDHPSLIRDVLKIMAPGSLVFFSTNHQRFEPCFDGLAVRDLIELTPKTIPEDYRNRKVHRCWKMTVL